MLKASERGVLKASRRHKEVPMYERVCLEDPWMKSTPFVRYLEIFNECFKASPELLPSCNNRDCFLFIAEALKLRSNHSTTTDDTLNKLWMVGDGKGRNRHHVTLACLFMLKFETSDTILAWLDHVNDRVYRCESAQKQAYVITIQHGARAFESTPKNASIGNPVATKWDSLIPSAADVLAALQHQGNLKRSSPAKADIASLSNAEDRAACESALCKIQSMGDYYIESHKEKAFKSSILEPARFYFRICGMTEHHDHVDIHGINGYLCLLRGWSGTQMPWIPQSDDSCTYMGCADVWAGLSSEVWKVFCDEKNFGKAYESIKELKRDMVDDETYGEHGAVHSFVGRNAGDMEAAARKKEERYQQYADKFAFFFTKEFLVKRMFETLNAEATAELLGFAKLCKRLYPLFKDKFSFQKDTLCECLYDDDLTHLDTEKATLFLWWLGFCKESYVTKPHTDVMTLPHTKQAIIQDTPKKKCRVEDQPSLKPASAPNDDSVIKVENDDKNENFCPICYEEKEDVTQIPHWEACGDIRGHKMCGDCRKVYTKNECPFCREVSLKENILSSIREFILQVKHKSSIGDPNDLAAILETWQVFEMKYGGNPKVIHRVSMLVVQDQEFQVLLQDGVRRNAPWMRDAAGIIFRLYGLSLDGHLQITSAEASLLGLSYRTILNLVKAREIHGHFLGAIYSQAMVPYICALQTGQNTQHLEDIVKEVGNLIVSEYLKNIRAYPDLRQSIPERIVNQYREIVTDRVWGGENSDPVWRALYQQR